MMIVRHATQADADAILWLAEQTGAGFTSLAPDRDSIVRRIEEAETTRRGEPAPEQPGNHFFVMEDVTAGAIVGTSGIVTGVGVNKPFYSYRLLHISQESREPGIRVDTDLLNLSNDFMGASEVGTLFLAPDYRQGNNGRLLSKARYMFVAAHPERVADQLIAEIRGYNDDDHRSPFWEAIGRHFFSMDFEQADRINGLGNSQFIADLMPKFPIYVSLLPQEAQDVIGVPHDQAKGAIALLKREGFRFSGAVDIFDAGPTMQVHRKGIWTARKSRAGRLAGTVDGPGKAAPMLVANPDMENFRVTLASLADTDSGVYLPTAAARALDLAPGDPVRFAPVDRAQLKAR
ncbi:arginine N-succinyltransferase [Yunchengibacter salinarum]|uniref:arginine N-succinyltransferase n=1 Tax=Yunchengibacter salinarum TaxID=3133399 RepID=UPI0035B5C730